MQVFTGDQAKKIIESGKFPLDSIGVSKVESGYLYYYYDRHTFDSGMEATEKLALETAKKNIR